VSIISLASVGVAARLRALDLSRQRDRPFVPGKDTALVERDRHSERLGFPWLAKHRPFVVARDIGQGLRGVFCGLRIQRHYAGSR
jgi:hypothetical protein